MKKKPANNGGSAPGKTKKPTKTKVEPVSDTSQPGAPTSFKGDFMQLGQDVAGASEPLANPTPFPAPFPTETPSNQRTKAGSERSEATDSTDGTAAAIASSATLATAEAAPFPAETTKNRRRRSDESKDGSEGSDEVTTTSAAGETKNDLGDDRNSSVGSVVPASLVSACVRLPNETRNDCWERLRRAARAAGMPRGQGVGTAYDWANQQTDRLFSEDRETIPFPAEVISSHRETISVVSAPPADDGSVSGLSDLPPNWPELPANAQLQVEIAWVTANRLRVRSGTGVDLSKALSPAPSYSALSWLETSILFPAKFADISVKATASQDDEKEFVKREKLAIEEIRSILTEMLEADDL